MGAPRPSSPRVRAATVLTLLVSALAVLGLTSAPAYADDPVGDAAHALGGSTLFVHPDATTRVGVEERDALRERLSRATTPVFVAVLPASAAGRVRGGVEGLPYVLYQQVRKPGTYAVFVADQFVAGSTTVGPVAGSLAGQAQSTSAGDPVTAVLDFTDLVEREAVAQASENGSAPGRRTPIGFPWTRLLLLGGTTGLIVLAVRRRRDAAAVEMASVREVAEEDVDALERALATVDPGDGQEAQAAYARAQRDHDNARAALLGAARISDLASVSLALADGRYELAAARALAAGVPVPARRLPCFFDPRHGPSHTDARWAPPGGAARDVPVCADCAIRRAEGYEPTALSVPVGDGRRPYWDGGRQYGPWAGGYFGEDGGTLLRGLLVGTALGSAIVVPRQRPAPADSDDGVDAP